MSTLRNTFRAPKGVTQFKTIMMTVFKQYREPGAGAITHVYSDVSMKVDEQSAEGKSYVTYKFSGFAKRRTLLT